MSTTLTPVPTRQQEPVIEPVDPILARAVGVLRRKGWTQKRLRDTRTGQVCAVGAIASVGLNVPDDVLPQYPETSGSPKRRQAVERLARSLGWSRRFRTTPDEFVTVWNDKPERTAEQVAEAIERAAYGL